MLSAKDGEEAIDVYQKHWTEIDTVVLDWRLPRLGGSTVFRKLKQVNPQVKVIGVSRAPREHVKGRRPGFSSETMYAERDSGKSVVLRPLLTLQIC